MSQVYKAQDFINAIPGSGGIVSTIAKRVGCTWKTAKSYIDGYPTVKAAYEDECEAVADLAESVLITSIRDGNTQDAKWYLARIRRGKYAERYEFTGEDGGPVTIRVVYGEDGHNA
jgi:hypothetical protein